MERKVFFGMGLASREKNQDRVKAFRCTKSNMIKTATYTILSFIPQNLFEQFQKSANKYFLLLVLLMNVPTIPESLPWYTMGAPLIVVLFMSALKDGLLDIKRHQADALLNDRLTYRRNQDGDNGDTWDEIKWHEVRIGDIIMVKKNMPVPADMVLLLSSDKTGKCNIETADLDGETNLKQRWVLPQLMKQFTDMAGLDKFMWSHQGKKHRHTLLPLPLIPQPLPLLCLCLSASVCLCLCLSLFCTLLLARTLSLLLPVPGRGRGRGRCC